MCFWFLILPSDWASRMQQHRTTGSMTLQDDDHITDAGGDQRITFTDAGSLIIKDDEIKSFIKDERGSYGKTSAENMISELKNIP